MHPVAWLALAIGSEIIATVALKLSVGFSKPIPSLIVVVMLNGAGARRTDGSGAPRGNRGLTK